MQSKTLAPRAVPNNIAFAGGLRQGDNELPLLVESDLSDAMAVGDQELDAIIRLLGDALDDVSIPSQRDLTRRFCEAKGWVVTTEFIEPGASATDDRRPAFQRMLEEAAGPERRFDIICSGAARNAMEAPPLS